MKKIREISHPNYFLSAKCKVLFIYFVWHKVLLMYSRIDRNRSYLFIQINHCVCKNDFELLKEKKLPVPMEVATSYNDLSSPKRVRANSACDDRLGTNTENAGVKSVCSENNMFFASPRKLSENRTYPIRFFNSLTFAGIIFIFRVWYATLLILCRLTAGIVEFLVRIANRRHLVTSIRENIFLNVSISRRKNLHLKY